MLMKEYVSALRECILFDGMDIEAALKIIEDKYFIQKYSNNRIIYTRDRFDGCVGVVLQGYVEVYKDEQKSVMLNRINKGGFFGAAALFTNKKEYVSTLFAKGDCTILFIPFESFKRLLSANADFAINYIKFLSGRIEFLNKKIDEFTAPDNYEKLCRSLLDNSQEIDGRAVCRIKSMMELSKSLNMGRASLYRSFDQLEKEGVIHREGKTIVIDDISKLKK